jgi:hypothetical protein
MKLPLKHIEFIRLVANGESQVTAYKVTCGNKAVTSNVAKVKGSQLAKKYANLIAEQRDNLKKVVEEAQKDKVAEIAQMNILTSAQRMEILSNIAQGKLKVKKPFVIGGKVLEYPSEPDHTDIKNAIAELNKMQGDYAPTKQDITTKGKEIRTWIVKSK